MASLASAAPLPCLCSASVPERDRDALVEGHLALVHFCAGRYRGRGVDHDDLVGVGWLGLLRAAELWDPSRGARFSSYASLWIRALMRRAIDEERDAVGRGVGGRDFGPDDVPDPRAVAPPEAALEAERRAWVREALRRLHPRHRRVVELRFGLDGGGPRTLEEAGAALGIGRRRAHQIERSALERLRGVLGPTT